MPIHYNKDEDIFKELFSYLCSLEPQLTGVRAFGTDGEEALSAAAKFSFRGAVHLQCFRHFEKNIETKLTKWNMQPFMQELRSEIFGSYSIQGLLNSTDEVKFDI